MFLLIFLLFSSLSIGNVNDVDDLESIEDLEQWLDEEADRDRQDKEQKGRFQGFDDEDEHGDDGPELTEEHEKLFQNQLEIHKVETGNCFLVPAFEIGCELAVSCHELSGPLPKVPANTECLWIRESFALSELSMKQKSQFWANSGLNKGIVRLVQIEGGIGDLPEDFFDGFTSLRFLNLEANRFQSLPEPLFDDLFNLKVLYLTGNHVQRDEGDELFQKYEYNSNRLTKLHSGQFKNMKNLKILLLHHNRLQKLPNEVFANNLGLKTLKLFDNRFRPKLTFTHQALRVFNRKKMQLGLKRDLGDDYEDELLVKGELIDKRVDHFYLESMEEMMKEDKMEL